MACELKSITSSTTPGITLVCSHGDADATPALYAATAQLCAADHANMYWVYAGPARNEPAAALKRAGAPAAAVESIQWHDVFTPCLEGTQPDVCTALLSALPSQSSTDTPAPAIAVIEDLGLLACSAGEATGSEAAPSAAEQAARRLAGSLIAWAAAVPSQVLVHCRDTDTVAAFLRGAASTTIDIEPCASGWSPAAQQHAVRRSAPTRERRFEESHAVLGTGNGL